MPILYHLCPTETHALTLHWLRHTSTHEPPIEVCLPGMQAEATAQRRVRNFDTSSFFTANMDSIPYKQMLSLVTNLSSLRRWQPWFAKVGKHNDWIWRLLRVYIRRLFFWLNRQFLNLSLLDSGFFCCTFVNNLLQSLVEWINAQLNVPSFSTQPSCYGRKASCHCQILSISLFSWNFPVFLSYSLIPITITPVHAAENPYSVT